MIRKTLPFLVLALFSGKAQAAEPLVVHEWGLWHLVEGKAQVMPQVLDTLPTHVHKFVAGVWPNFGTMPSGMIVKKPVAWFYGPEGTVAEYKLTQKDKGLILANFPAVAVWNQGIATWKLTLGPKNFSAPKGEISPSPWYDKLYLPDANAVSHQDKNETEGFLFYEASTFSDLPVSLVGGALAVKEPLPLVLAVSRDEAGLAVQFTNAIGTAAQWTFPTSLDRMETSQAVGELARRLIGLGLFEGEAKAFATVWQPELFETLGKRVLVILPQKTYARLLPVEIIPAPQSFVRVGAILVEMP